MTGSLSAISLGPMSATNLESSARMFDGQKRLLIISPHFPPVNAADMQRVRMLLPFFKRNGWQVEVLAVSPEQTTSPRDEWLLHGIPGDIPVHHARALGLEWSHIPGLGSLGFRAMRAFDRAGKCLLKEGKFDLIYFSTTVFEIHILGPRWKKQFNIPFVIDYQDPWVNDYYKNHPEIKPPGGRLKFAIIDRIHRWMEPRVLKECAGITSVSEGYLKQLTSRYPNIKMPPTLVQGFPGAKRDFERLDSNSHKLKFDKADGKLHWLYVGRGGADMATALRGLFMAVRDHTDTELKQRLNIHFIGTSYAAAGTGQKTIVPIAAEFGLEGMVTENTDRVAYSETLEMLLQADALIVPGSNDPSYTASKIYPYLLAERPLMSIFHVESSVVALIKKVGGAACVEFSSSDSAESIARNVLAQWLKPKAYLQPIPLTHDALEPFLDSGCASEISQFFSECLENSSSC